jgi:translation elongation factor EF-G/predicted RNA-binding protein with PIN domain
VLDCAILVISGTDGVQGHTHTLWQLLRRHRIPVFLFLNKMDLETRGREALLDELRKQLDENCVDFSRPRDDSFWESAAMCGEEALSCYLETGTVPEKELARLIAGRKLFPCWFGSALKLEGVAEFLEGLERYAPAPSYGDEFGAKVFKIARDPQGARLTYLKVTGGSLSVKDSVSGGSGEDGWTEKVDQIRVYSGVKFQAVDRAEAGTVCAVTGLSHTQAGEGLGAEPASEQPSLEPVLSYRMILPPGCDPHAVMPKLSQLEEEDPQLHLVWNESLGEIHLQLMGDIQLEVLGRLIQERFGLTVTFGQGSIVYRETITEPVEGVGHFEPLRHYAEVHLLLEPGERGSGLRFASACSTDVLDLNWQRLVLTHLYEREHRGVLTGAPITDMKITLVAGRAHQKHTEGGDFRQATYRAVRQGLMQAKSLLLEPWYDFRLELPGDNVGRAMADVQAMGGEFDAPQPQGELTLLTGRAPVAGLRDYWREVSAYTKGRGRLSCRVSGYLPCHDQAAVVEALGYQPERDVLNTADSVFCSHGAGFVVPWDQVPEYAHVESGLSLGKPPEEEPPQRPMGGRSAQLGPSLEQDKELQAIFERTYGKVKSRAFQPTKKPARTSLDEGKYNIRTQKTGPEYLLVDGYNIIFAWDELKAVAQENIETARYMLMDILADYRGVRQCQVILVFDAYKVKGNPGSVEKRGGIYVVYTKEAETADAYIEKTTYDLGREHRVRVATSDGLEQMIILGHGALRVSARAFHQEVEQAKGQISSLIAAHNRKGREKDKLQYTATVRPRQEK